MDIDCVSSMFLSSSYPVDPIRPIVDVINNNVLFFNN